MTTESKTKTEQQLNFSSYLKKLLKSPISAGLYLGWILRYGWKPCLWLGNWLDEFSWLKGWGFTIGVSLWVFAWFGPVLLWGVRALVTCKSTRVEYVSDSQNPEATL